LKAFLHRDFNTCGKPVFATREKAWGRPALLKTLSYHSDGPETRLDPRSGKPSFDKRGALP
jgi:hypothetical protein